MTRHWWTLLVFSTVFILSSVDASHFRGAIITWKPGTRQNEVIIEYRISWRMTFSSNFACTDAIIQQGTLIGGEGNIECFKNCYNTLGSLTYQCTDYSVNEDWSSGRGRITAILNPSYQNNYHSTIFEFGFQGSAWINTLVVGSSGSWKLRVKADLQIRSDTGRINSSPRAEISPIVRLQQGCNHSVTIPVSDPDDDIVKCRWAQWQLDECGSVCGSPPNAFIYDETCTITYSATRSGWYAVAIQVEDYLDVNSTIPLSSIPVQFLFNVYNGGTTCTKTTTFIDPTPPNNACIGVPSNKVLHTAIVARVTNATRSITEIKTISPLGMTKSHLYNVSTTDWRMNVTWSPLNRDIRNTFCFSAVESVTGSESDKRCVTLLAGVSPPIFLKDSQLPTGKIYPSNRRWEISADSILLRASRPSFIRLYNNTGYQLEEIDASDSMKLSIDTKTITFTTSAKLEEKQTYYFLFDFGIVKGTTYCHVESDAEHDPTFWRFRIRDFTPPTITIVEGSIKTNATTEIQWTLNEPATCICTLYYLNAVVETSPCNDTWRKEALQEGRYTLQIVATDLEGNKAKEDHTWNVDTTPPSIKILDGPGSFSNQRTVMFRWLCSYPCTTICSVSDITNTSVIQCPSSIVSWTLPTTASNATYNLTIKASDDVGNVNEMTTQWITDFGAPNIQICKNGKALTIDCSAGDLKPKSICNASVTDDLDKSPHLDYTDKNIASCGIERMWTAIDNAGNKANFSQTIHVTVKQNIELLRFPGPLLISCGAIENMTEVIESMFEVKHPCDMPVQLSFVDNPPYAGQCDLKINRTWTIKDDCGRSLTVNQPLRIRQARKPLSPVDGQKGLELNSILRWQSSSSSSKYTIYIWKRGTQRPRTTSYHSFDSFIKSPTLEPGLIYNWQVIYHYINNETYLSPIWSFETRLYVDFEVTKITIPPSAFTGESREVKWTVWNKGRLTAQYIYRYWTDGVYLSWDNNFQNAKLLARVRQSNIIYPNDGYSSSALITFDERTTGTAFVFVYTDIDWVITEHNKSNNIMRSPSSITVKLTPPPDLQVTSIHFPGGERAFSGSTVQLRWDVVNAGEGPTKDSTWWDRIWWSDTEHIGRGSRYFNDIQHTGNIMQNGNYSKRESVRIPEFISGDFYIIIETDVFHQVYEYLGEKDNLLAKKIKVLLTPPPDLEVRFINVSHRLITGNTELISWTVENLGNDSPKSQDYWRDKVELLSKTGNVRRNIGTRPHYGVLKSGETYMSGVGFYVSPDIPSGQYNILVFTDVTGRVFENTNDGNNGLSQAIHIEQALPDLKIVNFSVSFIYEANYTTLDATWKVQNIGNGKTLSNTWIDSLQVKSHADDYFSTLQQISIDRPDGLQPLETYNQNVTVVLPFTVYGNVETRLLIDNIYHSTKDELLNNNVAKVTNVDIKLRAADLIPSDDIQINQYILAGTPIGVTYNVYNKGTRRIEREMWIDRIFIVKNLGKNNEVDRRLDKIMYQQFALDVNGSYTKSIVFDIPKDISGPHFVVVDIDVNNDIFEGTNTLNNRFEKLINIEPAPAADLSVIKLESNVSIYSDIGRVISVRWKVTNLGNSLSDLVSWKDQISYKTSEESTNRIPLNAYTLEYFLEYHASYEQTKMFLFPPDVFGNIYLCLEADVNRDVYEAHSRKNNIFCQTKPLKIEKVLPALLDAQLTINLPNSGDKTFFPGSHVEINVTVTNIGFEETNKTSWIDAIFLSDHEVSTEYDLKQSGYHLKDRIHIGTLRPNQSYSFRTTLRIPSSFSGQPFFIVLPDSIVKDEQRNPNDMNSTGINKTDSFKSTFGSFVFPLNISLLLPNLEIESDIDFQILHGGQPISVSYNVTNTGNVSLNGEWYDSVYLSEDYIVDAFDLKLKSIGRNLQLKSGDTKSVNATFFLPKDLLSKSYYLAIICDSLDQVYEENEDDNVLRIMFDFIESVSSDIVVSHVKSPGFVEYGHNMKVMWEIYNNGTDKVSGYKCDSVFLSEDETWDISDWQIGQPKCSFFSLEANLTSHLSLSLLGEVPHVLGRYYETLVKSRTNAIDIHLENNVGVSMNKTRIAYQTLAVGTSINMTVHSNSLHYLQIVNVSSDKTLVVNLTSNQKTAFNNIFLKSSKPATLYDFDFATDDPNLSDQILSVPTTVKSDYYMLIENAGFLNSKVEQNISVSVKYATFEIHDVSPKQIIPGVQTTFTIKGSLFPFDMQIYLNSSKIDLIASAVYVFSSTRVYATFNIPIDNEQYNLTLFSPSLKKTIMYDEIINIRNGTKGYLYLDIEASDYILTGEMGKAIVEFANRGDSDIVVPILKVEASGGGAIKFDDMNEVYKDAFYVFGFPDQGPAGILLPNARGSLTFKSKQTDVFARSSIMKLGVSELVQSNTIQNPFMAMKDDMRPSHYSKDDWSPVWNNFIKSTGNSTASLARKMSDVLNEMSLAGRYVKHFDAVLKYLIDISDAPYGDRILQKDTDFDIRSDSNVRLVIERYLSARIGSRKQSGFMGKGWILPFWDTKIKSIDKTELVLTLEKEDYVFVKVDNKVYINKKLGILTENDTVFIFRSDKDGKEFHFDSETFRIKVIASLIDASHLYFEYQTTLLTVIRHSDGPFVSIRYNSIDQIQSMQLHNESIPGSVKQVRYIYDYDTQMLRQTSSELGTTGYQYTDATLSYVMYQDNSILLFQYNEHGHLKSRSLIVNQKKVFEQVNSFSSGGMLAVHYPKENENYRFIFSEDGDVIRVRRDGYLPDKTVFTKDTETKYEGDIIVTKRKYKNDGQHLEIEDGNGDQIRTIFNNKNQLTSFIDGLGNRYNIALNENGTLKNISFPDGSSKVYSYTVNGHITTTQSGATKRYEYNNKRQLQMQDIGNNSITTFEYDVQGNLIRAVNKHGEVGITYKTNKVTSVKYPTATVNYEYTENQQVKRLTTSNGYDIRYKYNENGQLINIIDKNDRILLSTEYNSKGKIIKRLLGNKALTNYEYDPMSGLLIKLSNYYPNGTLASIFNYTYSSRNRRIAVDTIEGRWSFSYDRAGQVISMTDPGGNITEYTYDSAKNRKIVSINGDETLSTINEMNQYTKYRDMTIRYDKNGNVVQRIGSIEEKYTYDEDNRIVSYNSNLDQCKFEYDALGNLFMKLCNGSSVKYLINPTGNNDMDILEKIETRGGKETVMHYYYGGDQIGLVASRHEDDTLNYFMYDPLGSVTNILDEVGNQLNSYQRNPFGEIISSQEKTKSMFTFVGQWGVIDFEEMSDVYLMRARLYDSYTGRFMSIDPLGLKAQSKNFYAYCANNPVHFNDPRGTCPVCVSIAFGIGRGLFDYLRTHDSYTWGGAAGAIIEGGLNGAIKFLPSPIKTLLGGGIHVLGSWAQHAIDGEPYSFKDGVSDFADNIMQNSKIGKIIEKAKKLNNKINKGCTLIERYNEFIHKACELKREIDKAVKEIVNDVTRWIVSHDPNDMIGPKGYGEARFIPKSKSLEYKIRFENNENATAPAQRVYIEHKYSKHLDERTFTMGNFGFGNFVMEIPPKSKMFQGMLDRTADLGITIRVFAGLDLKRGMVVWEFESIDKTTGEAPLNASIGFLPPNNGTTGQGYVTFTMKPKRNTPHLSLIPANATIYFDQNEPIDTPNIINTVDDSTPHVNGSIIAGTESTESVTLSLVASDTGSGVRYIDLFEVIGQGLILYHGGITENHYHIQLEIGESKQLLPIAVDHVGNSQYRNDFNIYSKRTIHVKSTVDFGTCECSGNGNCSARTGICRCENGFYGTSCNSTIPPPEPPLLELKSEVGFTRQPIELTISAKNLSGLLEDIIICISGIRNGTKFSKGTVQNDSSILLLSSEFGLINMTSESHGEQIFKINVIQQTKEVNFTRMAELAVMVYPDVRNISFNFEGCFKNDYSKEIVVSLNSSIVVLASDDQFVIGNESTLIPYSVSLILPSWARPLETFKSDNVYRIEETITDYVLMLNGHFEPFNITYNVKIEYDVVPSLTFTQTFKVSSFCNGDCKEREYSVMCDKTCACNWDNTVECSQFDGSCSCSTEWKGVTCAEFACPCTVDNTALCEPVNQSCECKDGWRGNACDIDVDECFNSTVCETFNNTGCQNKEWGYDCLCLVGYDLQNTTCIERNETVKSTVITDDNDEKETPVLLHLDIDLPPNVNLKVEVSYEKYLRKVTDMLTSYYRHKLADSFVRLIINSVRRGSLIVDHIVVTKDTEEGSQKLAIAVSDLNLNIAFLQFDGKLVNVSSVLVDNEEVKEDICLLFTSLNPCKSSECEAKAGTPRCKNTEAPAKSEDQSILIIALSVAIPVTFILVLVVTICCMRRKK